MPNAIELYDTTLRDGVQREGLSFSLEDKIKVARKLDALGVRYIEGGYPGSNPRDQEFFARACSTTWQQATIVAFGSSRYKGHRAESDPNLRALIDTGAPTVTIVCKNSELHVREVLAVDLAENLAMIRDSVAFLKGHGRQVFYDAEHFFDGWKQNRGYALACLNAAGSAGADCLVLCDTNGGTLTSELGEIVRAVRDELTSNSGAARDVAGGATLGIHTHNDAELAVANTLAAVQNGATQVQGTINGYGERCGNANLCAIIPTLKLKLGIDCVTDTQLQSLSEVSRYISELANLHPDPHMAYVGASAFAHKAGYHADAMRKTSSSYQHIVPQRVGNHGRILISELSGKGAVVSKVEALGLQVDPPERTQVVLERIKHLESRGYQFEGAEASFELMVRRLQPGYRAPFELVDFLVLIETRGGRDMLAEAMVKIRVNEETLHTAGEGNGPVHALDVAIRKALISSYPDVNDIRLTDYKVRVIDEGSGTSASVRVLIDSSGGPTGTGARGSPTWTTVGSSTNIIEASWLALADSLEYGLTRPPPTLPLTRAPAAG